MKNSASVACCWRFRSGLTQFFEFDLVFSGFSEKSSGFASDFSHVNPHKSRFLLLCVTPLDMLQRDFSLGASAALAEAAYNCRHEHHHSPNARQ